MQFPGLVSNTFLGHAFCALIVTRSGVRLCPECTDLDQFFDVSVPAGTHEFLREFCVDHSEAGSIPSFFIQDSDEIHDNAAAVHKLAEGGDIVYVRLNGAQRR